MAKTSKPKQKEAGGKPETKDICFVIMPFGGWFDSYYLDIYCPAITKAGFNHRRADDLYRPSNIVQDIWELTKKAKIILADLTNKNPNVFYELGLAHALAKPVIIITETIDDIPFDLRSLRIIHYDKNQPNWGAKLQSKIEKAIKETIESPNETIPTAFLETNRSDVNIPQISRHDKDLLEVKQEIESLKRQIIDKPAYTYINSPSSEGNYTLANSNNNVFMISDVIKKTILDYRSAGFSKLETIKMLKNKFDLSLKLAVDIYETLIPKI
jgi:hypothetical protein